MNNWAKDFLNFLFPPECHICGTSLAPHEKFVCSLCLNNLQRTGFHRNKMNPMVERFAGKFPFDRATGLFFYSRDSSLSKLVQDMKYRNFPDIGNLLGEKAGEELFSTGFFLDIDYIVPVPMHFFKQLKRGYNQTERIAEGLSHATGIPWIRPMKMTRSHKSQTYMSQSERMENSKGIFRVTNPEIIKNKRILLIDDICTTGSTLSEAAITLWQQSDIKSLSLFCIGVTF